MPLVTRIVDFFSENKADSIVISKSPFCGQRLYYTVEANDIALAALSLLYAFKPSSLVNGSGEACPTDRPQDKRISFILVTET